MNFSKYFFFLLGALFLIVLFVFAYVQSNTSEVKVASSSVQDKISVNTDTFSASNRVISITEKFTLPIKNIVPSDSVSHSIPLEEIRQGCSRQDCIPSVDEPEFISTKKAKGYVVDDQIGIALSYKGEERFYPFSMLVTRELVNDVVAGDPLLISYCPLCGTGIVFERTLDGVVYEFGVTGMLWQSNLLMYNRTKNIEDRSIWSQILGEAVVGAQAGDTLTMVTSDIMKFGTWWEQYPDGLVLDTGSQRDPYDGNYYAIAARFAPDFNPATSPMAPDTYVYGIEIDGVAKAYPRDLLPETTFNDTINGTEIVVNIENQKIVFTTMDGTEIDDIEGFWFSWVAINPDTLIWE